MTILEIMVVIVIIMIIASMLLPVLATWNARADEARCLANLRSLFVAASSRLDAFGEWPQIPPQLIVDQPVQYAKEWVQVLEPYGVSHASWICPTLQRNMGKSLDTIDSDPDYRIDYLATPFGTNPGLPRLAGRHPWFMELKASHSRGQLIILADGSTTALLDYFPKQP